MLVFKTRKEASSFLDSCNGLTNLDNKIWSINGHSSLYCGEYSPPHYTIHKYKDGFGIKINYFYYAGTFNVPKSHRINPNDLKYETV
jgi:hypothetical protein